MNSSRLRFFPWVTLFVGIVGLALRCWLFSGADRLGLLPQNHIAEILCFVLLAITLGVCALFARLNDISAAPSSRLAVTCKAVGALAMVISGCLLTGKELFPLLVSVSGIVIGLALLYDAFCRFKGTHTSPIAHYICMSFMIARIMFSCRGWSSQTQVQHFIFELFAALFFLVALYYRAQLDIEGKGHKPYFFFCQAALYCSCLSLAGTDFLFSLGASVWLAAESFGTPAPQGE